jgi:hypothetical protein
MEMEDCLHIIKVGQHSTMEIAWSNLKGYASTWWRTVRLKEGKTHGDALPSSLMDSNVSPR